MREAGTPLTAGSLGLSFHQSGWFIDLNGNYYDRIYLSYSLATVMASLSQRSGNVDNEDNYNAPAFKQKAMAASCSMAVSASIRLKRRDNSVFNLMVTNILNNQKIVSWL